MTPKLPSLAFVLRKFCANIIVLVILCLGCYGVVIADQAPIGSRVRIDPNSIQFVGEKQQGTLFGYLEFSDPENPPPAPEDPCAPPRFYWENTYGGSLLETVYVFDDDNSICDTFHYSIAHVLSGTNNWELNGTETIDATVVHTLTNQDGPNSADYPIIGSICSWMIAAGVSPADCETVSPTKRVGGFGIAEDDACDTLGYRVEYEGDITQELKREHTPEEAVSRGEEEIHYQNLATAMWYSFSLQGGHRVLKQKTTAVFTFCGLEGARYTNSTCSFDMQIVKRMKQ